jgi:hypothetical protein
MKLDCFYIFVFKPNNGLQSDSGGFRAGIFVLQS